MLQKAIGKNVLLKVFTEQKEQGGIIMPDTKKQRIGIILSTGEKVPEYLKEGLKVKYKEYFTGEEFTEGEKSFIIIEYTDILTKFIE